MNARNITGGTAKNRVEEQIEKATDFLKGNEDWIEKQGKTIQLHWIK